MAVTAAERRLQSLTLVAPRAGAAGAAAAGAGGPAPVGWCVPGVRPTAGPPRPSGVLQAARRSVEAVLAAPVSGRPVDVAALLSLAEQLRGAALAALAELDRTGGHHDDGAPTAAVWLRRTSGLGDDTARATVRLATRLRDELPALGLLLRSGRTTVEHVRAVAAGTAGLDPTVVRDAGDALCALALTAEPAVVRRELRSRAEAIDPELGRDTARRQSARQGLYVDPLAGAGVILSGSLTDEDGAVLLHGLDLAVEAARTAGDTRGLPARRAEVLLDWARTATASRSNPDSLADDAHTVRTHLLITCTPEQLTALATEHATSQLTHPGRTRRAADRPARPGRAPRPDPDRPRPAPHRRPAFPRSAPPAGLRRHRQPSPPTRRRPRPDGRPGRRPDPLYAGRATRTVTGAQFRALTVRDRHCITRGCTRPPAACTAHHVQHWTDGGPTDLDNLVLLCHRHHHDHHDRGHDLHHHDGRRLTAHGWATTPDPPHHRPPGPA